VLSVLPAGAPCRELVHTTACSWSDS
jgi:hypothetical protein